MKSRLLTIVCKKVLNRKKLFI